MEQIVDVWYQDGKNLRRLVFEMPAPARNKFESCYLFGLHKSGSVMANNIVNGLAQVVEVPTVDLPGYLFLKGISHYSVVIDLNKFLQPEGYCYVGFRDIFNCMNGILQESNAPKILMIRDPRDMLVSMYYSFKYSHWFAATATKQYFYETGVMRKGTEEDIDSFCISSVLHYQSIIKMFLPLVDEGRIVVIRYEDVVFEKLALVNKICEVFRLDVPKQIRAEIAVAADIRPSVDQPHEHVRQVAPGDHKRKLDPSTIEYLNAAFSGFMARFGYA